MFDRKDEVAYQRILQLSEKNAEIKRLREALETIDSTLWQAYRNPIDEILKISTEALNSEEVSSDCQRSGGI